MKSESQELIKRLVSVLEKEKQLLLLGIKTGKEAEELEKVESENVEVLSIIAQKDLEDFKGFEEELERARRLNEEVEVLLTANISFLENLFKELSEADGIVDKRA